MHLPYLPQCNCAYVTFGGYLHVVLLLHIVTVLHGKVTTTGSSLAHNPKLKLAKLTILVQNQTVMSWSTDFRGKSRGKSRGKITSCNVLKLCS